MKIGPLSFEFYTGSAATWTVAAGVISFSKRLYSAPGSRLYQAYVTFGFKSYMVMIVFNRKVKHEVSDSRESVRG